MAKEHVKDGVTYYEFTMEEFELEMFHLTGGDVVSASRVLEEIRTAMLDGSEERRRQARARMADICMGTCHRIPGREQRTPMAEEEQRQLGYIILTGVVLTAASGGLGLLATSGRAIQFTVATQNAVRTTGLAAQNTARVAAITTQNAARITWVVASDMKTKAIVATMPVTLNPKVHQSIIDFSTSLFPGSPTPNWSGTAGALIGNRTSPEELLR
jgi:hypothetical protein